MSRMHTMKQTLRESVLGKVNAKFKENLAFKPQSTQHQEMLNSSIAIFFAIVLQRNSTCKIVL